MGPRLITEPTISSLILFFSAVSGIFVGLVSGWAGVPICVVSMIVLHHAGHEAVHGSLSSKSNRRVNDFLGWIAFGLLGQNLILMRWSHLAHHRFGRLEQEYTIDRSTQSQNKLTYYACLLGASSVYHEAAGYVYPLLGRNRLNILTREFRPQYYLNAAYMLGQLFVLLLNVFLWSEGGVRFAVCKILFTLYWGATQNIAHYGLPVGRYPGARHASRTYRLPALINFMLFGAGPYHLEHHMNPQIPGPRLGCREVAAATRMRLGEEVTIRGGLAIYISDCLAQYKGAAVDVATELGERRSAFAQY